MRVVIMTPCLNRGDAVTNDALGMAASLQAQGHEVLLSSRFNDGKHPAINLQDAAEFLQNPNTALIYHHSIGNDEVVRIFEQARGTKIVKFHNITPPKYFKGLDSFTAKSCGQGLLQIQRLARQNPIVWADSDFNGKDWQHHSHSNSHYEVIPPFHQVDQLTKASIDVGTRQLVDDWRTTILMVARIAPNKNQLLAIKAFSIYLRKYDPYARLIIVGSRTVDRYCFQFFEAIRNEGLGEQIILTGKVRTPELKTFYLGSSMLLTTSLHEGFCVPLLEAMALKVPCIAIPTTAIPETGGDAVWYADENPEAIALMMHQVKTDSIAMEKKLAIGWERYHARYTNQAIGQQFLGAFARAMHSQEDLQVALDEVGVGRL
jgi:glycosyltransferase involved in cell wall biosynthesis